MADELRAKRIKEAREAQDLETEVDVSLIADLGE